MEPKPNYVDELRYRSERDAAIANQRRQEQASVRNRVPYLLQGFLPKDIFGEPETVAESAQGSVSSPAMNSYRQRVLDVFANHTIYMDGQPTTPMEYVKQGFLAGLPETDDEEQAAQQEALAAVLAITVGESLVNPAEATPEIADFAKGLMLELAVNIEGPQASNPAATESELADRVTPGMIFSHDKDYVTSEGMEKNLANLRALNLFQAMQDGPLTPITANPISVAGAAVGATSLTPDNLRILGYRLNSGLNPAEARAKEALYWDDQYGKSLRDNAYKDQFFGAYFPQYSNTNFTGIANNSENDRANYYSAMLQRLGGHVLRIAGGNTGSDAQNAEDRIQGYLDKAVRAVPVMPDFAPGPEAAKRRARGEQAIRGLKMYQESQPRTFSRWMPKAMHDAGFGEYAVYPSAALDTVAMFPYHNADPLTVMFAGLGATKGVGTAVRTLRGAQPQTWRQMGQYAGKLAAPATGAAKGFAEVGDAFGELAYGAPFYDTSTGEYLYGPDKIIDIPDTFANDPSYPEKYNQFERKRKNWLGEGTMLYENNKRSQPKSKKVPK